MAELIKFTSSFSHNILSFYGISGTTEEDKFEKEENIEEPQEPKYLEEMID